MSFAAVSTAIRDRFRTLVSVPQSVPMIGPNDPATLTTARWCQFTVEMQGAQQVGTGTPASRRYRITGRVALNLFEQVGKGDSTLSALMDAISTAFRGISLASPQIAFGAPSPIGPSVKDEAGAHWRMPAQIPFRADVFGTASST